MHLLQHPRGLERESCFVHCKNCCCCCCCCGARHKRAPELPRLGLQREPSRVEFARTTLARSHRRLSRRRVRCALCAALLNARCRLGRRHALAEQGRHLLGLLVDQGGIAQHVTGGGLQLLGAQGHAAALPVLGQNHDLVLQSEGGGWGRWVGVCGMDGGMAMGEPGSARSNAPRSATRQHPHTSTSAGSQTHPTGTNPKLTLMRSPSDSTFSTLAMRSWEIWLMWSRPLAPPMSTNAP